MGQTGPDSGPESGSRQKKPGSGSLFHWFVWLNFFAFSHLRKRFEDPGFGSGLFTSSGSGIQGLKRHRSRIRDPGSETLLHTISNILFKLFSGMVSLIMLLLRLQMVYWRISASSLLTTALMCLTPARSHGKNAGSAVQVSAKEMRTSATSGVLAWTLREMQVLL
jgi:hypothetical protein